MRNYAREWEYDSVGNILSIIHRANGNAWTRANTYAADSNRLNSTAVGQTAASFAYNAHGSGIRTRKVVEKNGAPPLTWLVVFSI